MDSIVINNVEDLGDGLYWFMGDIHCDYPRISTEIGENYVIFEFEPYTVKVTWENSNGKRVNPHWERILKEG